VNAIMQTNMIKISFEMDFFNMMHFPKYHFPIRKSII